jgi:hypothetical protein
MGFAEFWREYRTPTRTEKYMGHLPGTKSMKYRDIVETIARDIHASTLKLTEDMRDRLCQTQLEAVRDELLVDFIGKLEDDVQFEMQGMKFDA